MFPLALPKLFFVSVCVEGGILSMEFSLWNAEKGKKGMMGI